MQRAKVLIVEDDVGLAEALARAIGREHETVVAHTGGDALALARDDVDLILLDLNLPDMDGIDVAQRLAGHAADIVMVTARSDVASRVRGLYAGADDYVSKPFAMDELLARIFARLRGRSRSTGLRHGSLELDAEGRVCTVDGVAVPLTGQEFELLLALLERQGRVFAKGELEGRLFAGAPLASNALEVVVSRLRKKLAEAGADGVIDTVRGLGYVVRAVPR
jgi:DNA-binding response OmpR family regulator